MPHFSQDERVNRQIRARELRLIGAEGENFGVVTFERAFELAQERGLDLVEIGPKSVPPVAKILDYGKFLYEKHKSEKRAKAKTHITEQKAIQITIGTGEHDLALKAKKGSEWLHEGHRVKVDLFLRGRAKYLDPKFHKARLERLLHFITEPYKVIEEPKKSPKGMSLIIEKDRSNEKAPLITNKHENKQVVLKENQADEERQAPLAEVRTESL
ncbi:translation initiation factor IF-3 [bacterium]|nr:translation initiation factor IF-3 [bacterium]